MPRCLKLMADYGCSPLSDYGEDGDLYDNPDPTELPLSAALFAELNAWAAWYDTWIDMRDPYESRSILPEEDQSFKRAGRRLWAELRSELGDNWRVVYHEDGKVHDASEGEKS